MTLKIPFKEKHLKQFEKEMKEAGGFEELMQRKGALTKDEIPEVIICPDIEAYKEKYLTGVYEDLREYYDTEAPYMFWGQILDMAEEEDELI